MVNRVLLRKLLRDLWGRAGALLALLAIVGGLTVVLTRDVMRLILGLGLMLLSVAGLFGVLGAPFLTVAEIFVYVGGVLVLFLFGMCMAVMVVLSDER